MKRIHLLYLCLFWVFCFGFLAFGQLRPLKTDDAETIPFGAFRIQTGVEGLRDQTFRLSGLKGNLSRYGVLGIFIGAGQAVEFQMEGSVVNILRIKERFPAFTSNILQFKGDSTRSIGDLLIAAKFRLIKEQLGLPAVAFRFGAELPNAGNEKGIGNDETNFYASLMAAKSIGRLRAMVNMGIAILGDPTSANSQNDLFTYGLAGIYNLNRLFDLVGEMYGRTGPGGPGTDDQSQIRLGLRAHTKNLYWDFSAVSGLAHDDPNIGFTFGVSYQFSLFRPGK